MPLRSLHVIPVRASGNCPSIGLVRRLHRSRRPTRRLADRPLFSGMSARRRNRTHCAMALASAIAFAACAPASPVRWDEVQPLATAIDDASILVFTGDSVVTLVRDDASLAVPGGAVCEGSVRIAADGTGGRFAAWWSPRADSTAVLLVAASDGTGWKSPV